MRIPLSLVGAGLGALLGLAVPLRAAGPVIVHEWGTFTSLQTESGQAIGGINVDDEPVPGFVWQYANRWVIPQYSRNQTNFGLPPYNADGGKGWMAGDPTVTLRLETPVIYLYPPKGETPQSVPPLDVHVDFHGGVLSQYYPYAQTNGALLNGNVPYLKEGGMTDTMTTGLTWEGVQLGASGQLIETKDKDLDGAPWLRGQPVETDDKVWTTPREVSAPLLQVKCSLTDTQGAHEITQAEHFLFYRGVGHLDSPLQLMETHPVWHFDHVNGNLDSQHPPTDRFYFRGRGGKPTRISASSEYLGAEATYDRSWLVAIHPDGSCAFQSFSSFGNVKDDLGTSFGPKPRRPYQLDFTASLDFKTEDFSADNLAKLKASMQDALVKEGLYPDEASAMLRTWELSYFKSPGLRFFYIVPRVWVDKVLPLTVTGAPTQITRVMIGRIELISDEQRAALARLSAGPCPDLAAVKKAAQMALQNSKLSKDEVEAFYRGEKPLSELGITIPPLVQDYLSLGRFRDALIVHEEQQHPSAALAQFIKENGLLPGMN